MKVTFKRNKIYVNGQVFGRYFRLPQAKETIVSEYRYDGIGYETYTSKFEHLRKAILRVIDKNEYDIRERENQKFFEWLDHHPVYGLDRYRK